MLQTELWTRLLQLRYLLENGADAAQPVRLDRRQVRLPRGCRPSPWPPPLPLAAAPPPVCHLALAAAPPRCRRPSLPISFPSPG